MKKKYIKILIICIVLFSLAMSFYCNISNGFNTADWEPSDMTEEDGEKILSVGNGIIGFLQIVGSLVSVIALIIIGIKYMMGSVEEKAEYKRSMVPYVIGAIMVFGITNILAIVIEISHAF